MRDSWIDGSMQVIRKDFLPGDLLPLLQENHINGCVAVQADQSETETNFLLGLAENNDFIKGVVGWIDLRADNIEERLDHYSSSKKLKGFRHILQGEKDRAFMLQPLFMRGIKHLQQYGYTYDILIFPDQLGYSREMVYRFPGQKFVIDHMAKPPIKDQKISEWKKDIEAIASFKNVSCKISGLVTEADTEHWKKNDLTPYIDVVVNAFGTKRIMFGSDWPVCLLAASYSRVVEMVTDYFSSFSKTEQQEFFGDNAINFYNLA